MQRYFAKEKKDLELILNNEDIYHILTVMRMMDNDKIEVVYDHKLYICTLKIIAKNVQAIIIEEQKQLLNDQEITLIIPLLKEQKMDFILQKATELGVTKIVPAIMERSIIKLDDKKETKKLERWDRIVKEASEQSKRLSIPIITEIKSLSDLVDIAGCKYVCSTIENNNNIKNALNNKDNYDKISVVIGPEGGLTTKEEELLNKLGFSSISLGKRIMRVETVPIFILSVINYEMMK